MPSHIKRRSVLIKDDVPDNPITEGSVPNFMGGVLLFKIFFYFFIFLIKEF